MQLIPELECKVEAQFSHLQSQELLNFMALTESERSGYLVGSSLSIRLCEQKMARDIVILELVTRGSKAIRTTLEQEYSTYDKIGLIGNTEHAMMFQNIY